MFEVSNFIERSYRQQTDSPKIQADAIYRAEKVGYVWRLVNRPEGNPDDEEVVASFQGILLKIDMPPFNEKTM